MSSLDPSLDHGPDPRPTLTAFLDGERVPLDALATAAMSGGAGLGLDELPGQPLSLHLVDLEQVEASGRSWLRVTATLHDPDHPPGDEVATSAPLPDEVRPEDLGCVTVTVPVRWLEAAVDRALRGTEHQIRAGVDAAVARVRLRGRVRVDQVRLPDPTRPLRAELLLSFPKMKLNFESILIDSATRLEIASTRVVADLALREDAETGELRLVLDRLHDASPRVENKKGRKLAEREGAMDLLRAEITAMAGALATRLGHARVTLVTLPRALPGLDTPVRARLGRRSPRAEGGQVALDLLIGPA